MRKISFLILVYLFTTAGFFKSALEDCADILIKEAPQFNKNGIFNNIEMSNAEKLIAKKKWKKRLKEYKLKKKNNERDIGFFIDGYDPLGPPTYKKVLIKKISKQENQKAYKKFISESLKTKMKDMYLDYYSGYAHEYAKCVKYKKNNPELFKAKYD